MRQIVLTLLFIALLAMGVATLGQPLGLCANPADYADQPQSYLDAWYRYPPGDYPQGGARYETARAVYDADYGQGAFFRYYRAHPTEFERFYGPRAYDGEFGPRRF